MYARRQRRVQSASTNAQIQILYELVCLDIVQDELVTSMEMCGRWTSASYDCAFVLLRTCLLLLTNDVSAVPRRYGYQRNLSLLKVFLSVARQTLRETKGPWQQHINMMLNIPFTTNNTLL